MFWTWKPSVLGRSTRSSFSRHAPLRTKVSNAYQHGAAAVMFVTDAIEIEKRSAAAKKLEPTTKWDRDVAELHRVRRALGFGRRQVRHRRSATLPLTVDCPAPVKAPAVMA